MTIVIIVVIIVAASATCVFRNAVGIDHGSHFAAIAFVAVSNGCIGFGGSSLFGPARALGF
jgi:hypothetical protein